MRSPRIGPPSILSRHSTGRVRPQRTAGASRCRVRSRAGGKTTRPQPKPMSLLILRPWGIGSSPVPWPQTCLVRIPRGRKNGSASCLTKRLVNRQCRCLPFNGASAIRRPRRNGRPLCRPKSARLPWPSPSAHGRTRIQQRPANGSALTMAPAVIRRCKTSLSMWRPKIRRRRSPGPRRFPIPNFGPPPNSKSPVIG